MDNDVKIWTEHRISSGINDGKAMFLTDAIMVFVLDRSVDCKRRRIECVPNGSMCDHWYDRILHVQYIAEEKQ